MQVGDRVRLRNYGNLYGTIVGTYDAFDNTNVIRYSVILDYREEIFGNFIAGSLKVVEPLTDSPLISFEHVTSIVSKASYLLPTRATTGSAGYDFSIPLNQAPIYIAPKKDALIKTGVKAKMPEDMYLGIHIRSSTAVTKTLRLVNGVGIIDSDYYSNEKNDGEIGIILYNFGKNTVCIKPGERIAQGIFQKYYTTDNDLTKAKRMGATVWK